MKRRIPKHWLSIRFVALAEIVGYVLCGIVGIIVLCTFIVKVEILAHANGTLRLVSADVVVNRDALLTEYLVSTGDEVSQGAPVCRIITAPAAQRQALAGRQLQATISVLEQDPSPAASDTLERTRAAFATLPPIDRGEELAAPISGTLKRLIDPNQSGITPAGAPLATVYDMTRLVLEASIVPGGAADMVVEGQDVRVRISDKLGQIQGRVHSVGTDGTTKRASMYFEGVSPAIRERFRSILHGESAEGLATVSADIVVGHRSLFKDAFGRKK